VIRASAAQLSDVRSSRRSRQSRVIAAALAEAGVFCSAQQLYLRLRDAGRTVGLSTVYRCLHELTTAGEVDVVVSEAGEALYRATDHDDTRYADTGGAGPGERHRHFLVCRSCGAAVEIISPTIEQWVASTGRGNGYAQLTHRVEIFGICHTCRSAPSAAPARPPRHMPGMPGMVSPGVLDPG